MLPLNIFQGEAHSAFAWAGEYGSAVLVHGFPGTPAEMRPLADILYRAGWSANGLLLPGFGAEFEHITEKRAEDWIHAVQKTVDCVRKPNEPLLLIGYSMGGALAICTAVNVQPDGLILLAPFWKIDHLLWQMLPFLKYIFPTISPFKLLKMDFNDLQVRAGIANFMPEANPDDPDTQAAIREFRIPVNLFDQIRRSGALAFKSARLITVPTLIIQGKQDTTVLPHLTKELKNQFVSMVNYLEVNSDHDLIKPKNQAWKDVTTAVAQFVQQFEARGMRS